MSDLPQDPYLTSERANRLDLLCHLLANGRKPILLRGPVGAGKKFFLEQFVIRLGPACLITQLDDEVVFDDRDDLLRILETRFGDKLDKSLVGRLSALAVHGERCVLLVHDVHKMSKDSLRGFIALAEEFSSIFLILSTAENLPDIERCCQIIDLEPFTQKQTIEYARRLLNAEPAHDGDASALDELVLFIETGGLPGRIHDVVIKHVSDGRGLTPQKQKAASRANYWLYTAPLLAAVMAVLFYVGVYQSPDLPPEIPLATAEQPEQSGAPIVAQEQSSVSVAPDPVVEPASPPPSVESGHKTPVSSEVIAVPIPETEQVSGIEKPSSDEDRPDSKAVESAEIRPSPVPDSKPVEADIQQRSPIEEHLETEQTASPELTPDVAKSVPPKEPEAPPPPSRLASDRAWIKSMPGEQYTLQIMGLGKQSAAEAYLAKYPDLEKLYVYRSKRNQGQWYAILYGSYPSRSAAVKSLPFVRQQFPGVKPWLRRFDAVQADLY